MVLGNFHDRISKILYMSQVSSCNQMTTNQVLFKMSQFKAKLLVDFISTNALFESYSDEKNWPILNKILFESIHNLLKEKRKQFK